MNKYITTSGDMWDKISLKFYGSEHYMYQLHKENPEHINTVIFDAGVELDIPEINLSDIALKAPWSDS